MLAAAETGLAAGFLNATYTDNSTTSGQVLVPAFWSWPYPSRGDLVFPFYYSNKSVDYNRSNIFQTINWVDSSREIDSITLPSVTAGSNTGSGGATIDTRLHIFSLTLWSAKTSKGVKYEPSLQVQYARSTQKWTSGTNKTQIVEVLINNLAADGWVLRSNAINVTVESDGVETVKPGVIKRLRPGDQVMVEVGIENKKGVAAGALGKACIKLSGGNPENVYTFNATFGIAKYLPTHESIYTHESPSWYNGAKYGIFIHWGVYAVPGWCNAGKNETYAEWYWWNMNQGPNTTDRTWEHHLSTYGQTVVYDDFIENFTANAFNPKEWVDLFADAGVNYFVQVSKHHDGHAIFDLPSNVTEHYARYGFGQWPGGNATNPYTNITLAYTGYVPLEDYITDKILPEMKTLADMGTELLWCDIGRKNRTAEFASAWFNTAADENRQVLMDARCRLPGDFDTPEYARYGAVQRRKWETSMGMDPYSYGYNGTTPAASYMNASTIVTSLIDIVSKNGNYLLDIGRLPTPEEGPDVRFTKTIDAFYILALSKPNSRLVLTSPLPWVIGDDVTIVGVGVEMAGTVVPSHVGGNGGVELSISQEVMDADQYSWVFKIEY